MFAKLRFGSFLLAAFLFLGSIFMNTNTAQAHEMPLISSTQDSNCPVDMSEIASHCCVSTACLPIAMPAPRTFHQSVKRTQVHNQTDRYKHTHMYFPGVDTPPPRALS